MKSNTGIQIFQYDLPKLPLLIIISFISISSSIGTSEEELKVHFKEKHKINTVKPFLIKRICRICDYDKSTSNDQLVKHITDEHPRSDYGDEDEGNLYFILFYTGCLIVICFF